MAKMGKQRLLRELAIKIVAQNPGGIRYKDLVDEVVRQRPEDTIDAIRGSLWDLDKKYPRQVTKPSRGILQPVSAHGDESSEINDQTTTETTHGEKISESSFYEPFADWLRTDLDEVNIAIALGGAGLRSKWGTPDVVGVYKPSASDRVKFPLEIISAEVKISPIATVEAFGQAVAYRLFSSKSYLVLPTTTSPQELNRIESLSMLFGIGLVVFDVNLPDPKFTIRMRAQRFSPDMFYVNEFADRLREHDPEAFEKIFG